MEALEPASGPRLEEDDPPCRADVVLSSFIPLLVAGAALVVAMVTVGKGLGTSTSTDMRLARLDDRGAGRTTATALEAMMVTSLGGAGPRDQPPPLIFLFQTPGQIQILTVSAQR